MPEDNMILTNSRGSVFEPSVASVDDLPIRVGVLTGAEAFLYHWHDAIEILFGLEGCTTVGVMDRPYQLCDSDILLIAPGENHCLFPSSPNDRRLVIMIEPAFLFGHAAFAEDKDCFSQAVKHSSEWPEESRQKIRDCLDIIYKEYFAREKGWKEIICGQLLLLTGVIIREIPRTARRRKMQQDNLLRQILTHLSEHYLEPVSLESCAADLGFNPSYLSALFKQKTGASFHQYLINLRLNKAEWLLINTDIPVTDVSEQSGFVSDKTFYRVFRDRYGISPTRFRKSKQG